MIIHIKAIRFKNAWFLYVINLLIKNVDYLILCR